LHTPIEETVRAINHVIAQGKVFYWGTSEWEPEQIREAISVSKELGLIGPIVEQPQYSMLHRTRVEKEYKTLLEKYGTGLTTYSPLAMGLLSGKYSRDKFDENSRLGMLENFQNDLKNGKGMNGLEMKDFNGIFDRLDALKVVASELECSLAQLALAWVRRGA
jgi:aryl-alcohol dehydrogenase-like predicted oxidoreductase